MTADADADQGNFDPEDIGLDVCITRLVHTVDDDSFLRDFDASAVDAYDASRPFELGTLRGWVRLGRARRGRPRSCRHGRSIRCLNGACRMQYRLQSTTP